MLEQLKHDVCQANLELKTRELILYSWGNVSGIDRSRSLVAIKPSGVSYETLKPEHIVIVDMDANVVEGSLKPSSDTATHLELYRQFDQLGGICHTHSNYATMWAQACREIPCFGTTHADYCYGPVPVTPAMSPDEIQTDYELNTGKVIVRTFNQAGIDPTQRPAVLVANHGPFTWGKDPAAAVESAVILEQTARMALGTISINPQQHRIEKVLLDKHYLRKHGKNAYYGQK